MMCVDAQIEFSYDPDKPRCTNCRECHPSSCLCSFEDIPEKPVCVQCYKTLRNMSYEDRKMVLCQLIH